ncbi:MAG: Sigma-70 region 2 [Thermoleophilaceae bacterium]|jgi:DNA-directed RNA polymerase specialized sigma24 family protein|nr:Sigma-70 region 2 [Thermoleophilaceae bacterium]
MIAAMADLLERQAVTHASEGDRGALRFIYMRYERAVERAVRHATSDAHQAEAITRAVFDRLPRALDHYDPATQSFGDWLLLLARNTAREWSADDDYLAASA